MNGGVKFDIHGKDRTGRLFDSVKQKVGDVKTSFLSFEGVLKRLPTVLAGLFTAGWIRGVSETIDRIDDLSKRLGIGVDQLSKYRLAAAESGVEFEAVANMMRDLGRKSSEAADRMSNARKAFNALGIDARKFKELDIDEQFRVLAAKMQDVPNHADRLRIAMDLMSTQGAELMQIIGEGPERFQQLIEDNEKLGLTMNQVSTDAVTAMGDSFGRLQLRVVATSEKFVGTFAPAITMVADLITKSVEGINNLSSAMVDGFSAVTDQVAILLAKGANLYGIIGDEELEAGMKRLEQNAKKGFEATGAVAEQATEKVKSFEQVLKEVSGKIEDEAVAKKAAASAAAEYKKKQAEAAQVIKSTLSPFEEYEEQLKRLNLLLKEGHLNQEQFTRATINAQYNLDKSLGLIKDKTEDTAAVMRDSFRDALSSVGRDFTSLRDIGLSVLDALQGRLANKAIDAILGGTGKDSSKGLLSPVLDGLGGAIEGIFGGFFAEGGTLGAGKWGIVGERGPEIISAGSSPVTVTPMQGGGSAGGAPVTVNFNISTGVAPTVRAELAGMLPQITEQVKAAVMDGRQRGGRFAAAFEG